MSNHDARLKQSLCSGQGVSVIYDEECPLCSAYITRLRLARAAGPVELVNAREYPALVAELSAAGHPLDDGMVVRIGDTHYHGAAAVNVLALMSSRAGWFNHLNFQVFRSRTLSRLLYPILVLGRRLLLWLLGRSPLQ